MKYLLSIFSLFAVLCLFADVTCIWNGSEYVCSGEGSSVIVEGGGGLAPVVTNMVGVCTNCSAIAPADLMQISRNLYSAANNLESEVNTGLTKVIQVDNAIKTLGQDIQTYRRFSDSPTRTDYDSCTNYASTLQNEQCVLVNDFDNRSNDFMSRKIPAVVCYNNGIYDYANNVALPRLMDAHESLASVEQNLQTVNDYYVPQLRTMAGQLEEGAVECQASTNGNEGSSSVVTNVITGNWCTYDQGEAIKELLDDLKSYTEDQLNNIRAISNFTEGVRETIATGLFSQYTAIPADTDWQTLYLNGASTDWGYSPTNTLQRLEVLLFGLAGVTNSTLFTDEDMQSEGMQDRFEDESQSISNSVSSIVTDASEQEVQSLGSALVALFRAFSRRGASLQNGEMILPSVSLSVGEQEIYVPSFVVDGGVDMHNQLQTAFSLVFTVLYSLGAAFVIFFYWRWFADKAITFSKWGVELVSSMFAQ